MFEEPVCGLGESLFTFLQTHRDLEQRHRGKGTGVLEEVRLGLSEQGLKGGKIVSA